MYYNKGDTSSSIMYIEIVDETGQVFEEIIKQTKMFLLTGKEKKEMAVTV